VTDDLGDERQFWKPHIKPYEEIRKYFEVTHQDCVYIGDNEKKDFITAKKLGWKTIRIARDGAEYESLGLGDEYRADYELSTLNQLKETIAYLTEIVHEKK